MTKAGEVLRVNEYEYHVLSVHYWNGKDWVVYANKSNGQEISQIQCCLETTWTKKVESYRKANEALEKRGKGWVSKFSYG